MRSGLSPRRTGRQHVGERAREPVEKVGIRLDQVEGHGVGTVVGDDPPREVAPLRVLPALRAADELVVVARGGPERKVAFERGAKVRRPHRPAGRVADAGAEQEGVRLAAVRRIRQRRREVGHELRSGRTAGLVERRKTVSGHPQEGRHVRVAGKGDVDVVDEVPLLGPISLQHERPAAVAGARAANGDEQGVA